MYRLMQTLGCGLPGWNRALQKLQADRKQLKNRLEACTEEIAQTYAHSLLPQLLISNGWLHSHRCTPLAALSHPSCPLCAWEDTCMLSGCLPTWSGGFQSDVSQKWFSPRRQRYLAYSAQGLGILKSAKSGRWLTSCADAEILQQ